MRWPAVFAVLATLAGCGEMLPGDGAGDWIAGATLAPRYIPHAVDPAQGTLISANADPVGATFDGLPRRVFH